jgi:hypothetical protein
MDTIKTCKNVRLNSYNFTISNLLSLYLPFLISNAALPVELVRAAQRLYASTSNARFLLPVMGALARDEAVAALPRILLLPTAEQVSLAFERLLTPRPTAPLTPAQLFVALHAFDRDGGAVPVKRVVEAANMCHEQKAAFTQDVMARALQQVCT